jgi:hypothetical protein
MPQGSAVNPGWCSIRSSDVSRDAPTDRRRIGGDIMGRSLRLLAGLALGVALASAIVVAAAAQPTPPTIKDQNDRRTLNPLVEEAWRSREAVERFRSGERNFVPDPDLIGDVVAPPPGPSGSSPGSSRSSSRCRGGRQFAAGPGGGRGRRGRRPGRLDRRHPSTPAPAGFHHLTCRSTLTPGRPSKGPGCRQPNPPDPPPLPLGMAGPGPSGFPGALSTSTLRSTRGS